MKTIKCIFQPPKKTTYKKGYYIYWLDTDEKKNSLIAYIDSQHFWLQTYNLQQLQQRETKKRDYNQIESNIS